MLEHECLWNYFPRDKGEVEVSWEQNFSLVEQIYACGEHAAREGSPGSKQERFFSC